MIVYASCTLAMDLVCGSLTISVHSSVCGLEIGLDRASIRSVATFYRQPRLVSSYSIYALVLGK